MRVGAHPFRASTAKDVLIRVSALLDYEITHDPCCRWKLSNQWHQALHWFG
jgi:hypothetical protein